MSHTLTSSINCPRKTTPQWSAPGKISPSPAQMQYQERRLRRAAMSPLRPLRGRRRTLGGVLRLTRPIKRRTAKPCYDHSLRPKPNGLGLPTRPSNRSTRPATGTSRARRKPTRSTHATPAGDRRHDYRHRRVCFSLPPIPRNTDQGTRPQETLTLLP